MSRFLDVTYSENIVEILIMSFKSKEPGFKLTSYVSRGNLTDGREGSSGSNLWLKYTFQKLNFAENKFKNMMFVIAERDN